MNNRLLFVVAAVVAMANCLRLFWDSIYSVLYESFDTGWLVRTGEYIILSLGVPHSDIFSWTYFGRSLVVYQWLPELFCGLLFKVGGLWFVGLFFAVAAGALYLFLLPALWIRKGTPIALPYTLLALVLSPHWFNVRPQMFSYLLLLLFIYRLEDYRQNGKMHKLWIFPAVCLVWANTHLFWSIGLMLILIYGVFSLFSKSRSPILLFVFAVSALTIFVNPYGAGLVTYLISFLDHSQFMGMDEVQPLITMQGAGYILAFLIIAWQALLAKRQFVPREGFVVALAATIAALAVRRYGSLAVILIWPYLGIAFAHFDWKKYADFGVDAGKKLFERRALSVAVAFGVVLISAFMWQIRCRSEVDALNVYTEDSLESVQFAGRYLTKADRVFNDPPTGDWLILLTHQPVYIDTRYDMYPKLFCADAFACGWGAPGAVKYIEDKHASHIFIRDDFKPLNQLLNTSADWVCIIDDGNISLWGRSDLHEADRLRLSQVSDELVTHSGLSKSLIERTIKRRCQKYVQEARALEQKNSQKAASLIQKAMKLMPESDTLKNELQRFSQISP